MTEHTDRWALYGAILLLVVAFAASLSHTYDAMRAWGQSGWLAAATTAMPELTMVLCARSLQRGGRGWVVWLGVASAGCLTVAGNVHSAIPFGGTGLSVLAAVLPAWFAVLAVLLSGVHPPGGRLDTSVLDTSTLDTSVLDTSTLDTSVLDASTRTDVVQPIRPVRPAVAAAAVRPSRVEASVRTDEPDADVWTRFAASAASGSPWPWTQLGAELGVSPDAARKRAARR